MKKGSIKPFIPICIIAYLGIIYIAGFIVFSYCTFPDSHLKNLKGDYDISLVSADAIDPVLNANDECVFKISKDGLSEISFSLKDIRDNAADSADGSTILKQQAVNAWPVELFKGGHYYQYDIYPVDNEKLDKVLTDSEICDGIPSEDAYITSTEDGDFVLVDEVYGTQLDVKMLSDAVKDAICKKKAFFDCYG